MTRKRLAAALVLAIVPLAQASVVEDLTCTGLDACFRYQNDAETGRDASDRCAHPDPVVPLFEEIHARLVPPDDNEDNWALIVEPWMVGRLLKAHTHPHHVPVIPVALDVYEPASCGQPVATCVSVDGHGCQVQVPIDRVGVYVVRVAAAPVSMTHVVQMPGPIQANSHCSPACYGLLVEVA